MTLVFDNENKGKPSFTFIVATQTTEEEWRSGKKELLMLQSLSKMTLTDVDVRVWVFFDNHDGLPTCYNKALDNIEETEFTALVHDDLWLNDVLFFDKVINSQFDVIGTVGGIQYCVPFDWGTRPFLWTEACVGKASGFVQHVLPDGRFLPSSYGVAPSPVVWLDGQCLILNKKARDAGLRFDQQFTFDHYDGDLCLSAQKLGLKVGTAPILATHGSRGEGMMAHKERYMDSQRRFIEKWRRAK